METQRLSAGQRLRTIREEMGLTIREVEAATTRLVEKNKNEDYLIPMSRLSDIETKGIVPSIYRLYSLAAIYRRSYDELAALYGVNIDNVGFEEGLVARPDTHTVPARVTRDVQVPVKLDPGFHSSRTSNLGRMIQEWGPVPFAYLERLAAGKYTYGYIGESDFTMYPLIVPGSFIQVDEQKSSIVEAGWASEYERPIYFIETRDGYICSWCAQLGESLIVQPHPLSQVAPRVLGLGKEAEVIGQVVGVAMRLDARRARGKPTPKP